jgi:D-alanyl-D-alanine carboxypeptidase/D-alanyl-D-alanine-endopeptidase (penicillin-binding protein 4)
MDSMGIAGVDGRYLKNRFAGTDLRGRVLLKSGFVNNVSGISGYLHAKDGLWYAFSILMNGIPDGSNSGAKTLQERIVKALDASVAPADRVSASGQ